MPESSYSLLSVSTVICTHILLLDTHHLSDYMWLATPTNYAHVCEAYSVRMHVVSNGAETNLGSEIMSAFAFLLATITHFNCHWQYSSRKTP